MSDDRGTQGRSEPTTDAPDAADPAGDAMEHLWAAAHELLQAARAVIDAADAVVLEQQRRAAARPSPPEPRLRRIDVG
jgi:hypothetical protein